MTGWCPYKTGTLEEQECHFDGYCSECPHYKKDPVSRQAVLRCIKESRENIDWGQSEDGDAFLHYSAALYRTIASPECLHPAQPEQRWIPCSERVPVQNGVYVVTRIISDGFEYNNITDCCYFDGANTWHDDTRVNHGRKYLADVVAWQPLPEPYQQI